MLSIVKNKLIHAELNSQVQLDNQMSPSGSMNFSVFMSGFSTATLTFTKNWELLEEVYIFTTQKRQFKFSCGLVPGGKSPLWGLVRSQGSGTLAVGSRCLFFRLFPLAFPQTAPGTGTPSAPGSKVSGTTISHYTFGHEEASEEGNQHQFRLLHC